MFKNQWSCFWVGLVGGLLVMGTVTPRAIAATTDSATTTSSSKVWKVGTKSFQPFVFLNDQGAVEKGYSIDLWNKLSEQLGIKTEFVVYPTVSDLIHAVETNQVDAAIAGISITAERETKLDFTHSFYHTGLGIMIRDDGVSPLKSLVQFLFSKDTFQAIALLFGLSFLAANILWLCEHQKNPNLFPQNYFKGIWEALWWSLVTAATVGYGDRYPITVQGRLVCMVWMFSGLVVVAQFTSAITASRLQGSINNFNDILNKKVAVIANTTTEAYLKNYPIRLVLVKDVESSYALLKQQKVDAIVNDAPVLLYYAAQHPEYRVLESIFNPQEYGIAVPPDHRDRVEELNRILLKLKEDGTTKDLDTKWFPFSN